MDQEGEEEEESKLFCFGNLLSEVCDVGKLVSSCGVKRASALTTLHDADKEESKCELHKIHRLALFKESYFSIFCFGLFVQSVFSFLYWEKKNKHDDV